MTRTQTRREKVEEREQTIISAAHDEFLKHGFTGAKMAAIAGRAGVAEGTVYLYFRSKDALLLAVVGQFYERLTARAAAGIRNIDGIYERLAFIARNHIESCLADWRILELMMAQYRRLEDYESGEPYRYNKTYVAVFDRVVRDAVSRDQIRDDIPLHVIRDLFFGALEYATRTHMLKRGKPRDVDLIVDTLMTILERGIGVAHYNGDEMKHVESVIDRLERVATRLENETIT